MTNKALSSILNRAFFHCFSVSIKHVVSKLLKKITTNLQTHLRGNIVVAFLPSVPFPLRNDHSVPASVCRSIQKMHC